MGNSNITNSRIKFHPSTQDFLPTPIFTRQRKIHQKQQFVHCKHRLQRIGQTAVDQYELQSDDSNKDTQKSRPKTIILLPPKLHTKKSSQKIKKLIKEDQNGEFTRAMLHRRIKSCDIRSKTISFKVGQERRSSQLFISKTKKFHHNEFTMVKRLNKQ